MILLISERLHWKQEIAHTLFEGGIYLFCASYENALFMMRTKDIGGMILDGVPDPEHAAHLAEGLRSEFPDIPMALVLTPSRCLAESNLTFPVESTVRAATVSGLIDGLLTFCMQYGWKNQAFSSFELSVGNTTSETFYMGYALPLSRRAHALLRCLFYRAPHLTSSDDLMSLCYLEERKSISNVALLVHQINQIALQFDPRPLIVNVYGKGYRLRDGIVESNR